MFDISFRIVCVCLLLQVVCGKFLDSYGYQEIEESFPIPQTSIEEVKNLEFNRLSDEAIEEICKNFKVTIHIKEPESYVNCLESLADRSRNVILMKRDVGELEGSGDSNDPATTETPEVTDGEEQLNGEMKVEKVSDLNMEAPPENEMKVEEPVVGPSEKTSSTPTEKPGSFQGGFDNILKNIPKLQNDSLEDFKNPPPILKSPVATDQLNIKPDSPLNGEEAKTGESQEKPSSASSNSMLLIVIGALGVIGAVAFVYNFVRSRRESREIDEVVRLESEGKELKEMKPLMRSPLVQNGAKSLEFIDADPQIIVAPDTSADVSRES